MTTAGSAAAARDLALTLDPRAAAAAIVSGWRSAALAPGSGCSAIAT
ncbi:hypothetical protein [Nocardia lijiangensis]|nr:hypothetical protein [Nocardia lijiangensis]